MVHESIPSLVNALGNNVKVSTVWETKDHFLKDYTPYVQVIVKGRLTPTHWEIIQAQKGMITLDARCGICDCIDVDGKGVMLQGSEGFMTFAFTPIQDAVEKANMTEWVRELQAQFAKAGITHTHAV